MNSYFILDFAFLVSSLYKYINRPRGKESTEVRITQNKGKESENSYQKLKRSPRDRHTKTVSRYFDRHSRLYQSEESKCLWTHDKDGITREFMKDATRGLQEEWIEGNLKGNYLRLMPGLCLEDRTNW